MIRTTLPSPLQRPSSLSPLPQPTLLHSWKSPLPRSMMRPETTTSVGAATEARYRGVRKRAWGKWVAEIRLPNCRERIWLGSYETPEKAARAFDAATYCLRGRRGRFNFPHDVPDIPRATSLTPSEIQVVAARFAHEAAAVAPAASPAPPTTVQQLVDDRDRSPAVSPAFSASGFSSDEGITAESDGGNGIDWSFFDAPLAATTSMGVGGGVSGFGGGFFPSFDDYPTEFYPPPPAGMDPGDDNGGGYYTSQHSFLWNF